MLDRTQAPKISEISTPKIPEFAQLTVEGGRPLYLINQGTQPVIVLEIDFPVGRWNEPKAGLSYFTARMLNEGTKHKSSEEIAETFDFYGSYLEITPTLDSVQIKLYALKKHFPRLVNLLFEILREASFPEKEFDTIKRIRIERVRQQHAKNNSFAGLKFRESLFGPLHPYGEIIDEKKVEGIHLDEVRDFHSLLLSKPTFYLSGMVDAEDTQVVQEALKSLSFSSLTDRIVDISPAEKNVEILRNSTQASIRQGHLSISKNHADTHNLKIANVLFGGFFGSRLMKNIREEKGLTYGIHSSIMHLQKASFWQISTEVFKDKLELAKAEIGNELYRLQSTPPEADELKMVTNYMKGKFLNSFDTPFSSLNMIKNLHSGGLDVSYYHAFLKTLEEVTPEKVMEMAQKHFRKEDLIEVSVI